MPFIRMSEDGEQETTAEGKTRALINAEAELCYKQKGIFQKLLR